MLFILVCCVFIAVCRDTIDSCVLILCPKTLPSSIQALSCSVCTQTIRPRANRNGLISSFSICVLCLFFVCPRAPTTGIVVMRVEGPPCGPQPPGDTSLTSVTPGELAGGFCGCPLSDQGSFPLVPLPRGGLGPLPSLHPVSTATPSVPQPWSSHDLTAWPLAPLPRLRSKPPWTCWPRRSRPSLMWATAWRMCSTS